MKDAREVNLDHQKWQNGRVEGWAMGEGGRSDEEVEYSVA